MKKIIGVLGAVALAIFLLSALPARAQNATPAEVLRQADAAWNEKSYARALELYRQAQKQGNLRDADEVQYRIAVALGKTEKWDEAIVAAETLLEKTTWKARVLYWLGELYTKLPHQGYKVGGKTYRGQDYPKPTGDEKPEAVYLHSEDQQKALEYFEGAKIAAPQEREFAMRARFSAPTHLMSLEDEIDLNFDLAAYLPTQEYSRFRQQVEEAYQKKTPLDETVDLKLPYDPKWHLPKKVLYLYNQIRNLDVSKDHHKTALSLYSKGFFVQSYRQAMRDWAHHYTRYDEKTQQHIPAEYPFDHLLPLPIWQQLVTEFPRDPLAPQTQILIAQTYQQGDMYTGRDVDLVKALAAYRVVLEKYPQSKWVNDARAAIQQITKREMNFSAGQQAPGKNAKINVNTRNVKRVDFAAYRVRLEEVLTQPRYFNNAGTWFTNLDITPLETVAQRFGAPAANWTLDAKDRGDHQAVSETIDTPFSTQGAYLIVAQSGDQLYSAQILVISDLAILKKVDRNSALAYVADAQTGHPVANIDVIIKENYYESESKVGVARGKSDEVGLFEKKLSRPSNSHGGVQVFAWQKLPSGGVRYAVTGGEGYGYYYGYNRDEMKVYSYTDRPVYRPGQKVYFRQILTQRIKGGEQEPIKDEEVHVTIRNPKGENIFDKKLKTSEFGTINGEFDLPGETPLGEYYMTATVTKPNNTRELTANGGNRFRVEEYKRPEFQVSVDAPQQVVRPGETVAAKVNLKYYFGSPVPDAKVKYTIRRSTWWAYYEFPRPFSWLYRYWNVGDYSTGRRNIGGEGSGTIVKEGIATTDAQGNAEVTFETNKIGVTDTTTYGWWERRYSNPLYTIQIEATDASRRTIEGQGAVRVANQQYFAFLNAKQGYYMQGDRVQVEVVTQDANNKPVGASGKMVVYQQLHSGNNSPGDPREEKIHEEVIRTDDKGRVFWTWQADTTGRFRIAYEATDDWGQPVVGSTDLWVGGAGLDTRRFSLQGVTLVLNQHYHQEGDTLKALLIAHKPDTTVLLTHESGGDILGRQVVHIEGKSKEVSFTVNKQHAPNFMVAIALVKDFQIYQSQQEVFVPPTRQFINVSLESTKDQYKPGEKGTFKLQATDWEGKPARAEISLALTDASLFYIQKDYAPDIRLFYHGERRTNQVRLDSHRSGHMQGYQIDKAKYQEYEMHQWTMPDELGRLNLPPGFGGYSSYHYFRGNVGRAMGTGIPGPQGPMGVPGAAGGPPGPMYAPATSAPMMEMNATADRSAKSVAEPQLAEAQVRSNFAETAFWSPAVVTENGQASVEVTFPDSLTQWHATARGLTRSTQVGAAEDDVVTKKNLLVRMQAPRFFVERDKVMLTANVHNYLKTDKRVKVSLKMDDTLKFSALPDLKNIPINSGLFTEQPTATNTWTKESGTITVKAGEEARVNWIVDVARDGKAALQMTAQTDEESDAVKMEFPVLVHGIQRFTAQAGVLREGSNKSREVLTINIPKERRFGASSLNVQLNPSLAATMMDALPYLMDYPYGCVEQTMSRFLPSVVTAKVLSDSGVNLQTLGQRARAYEAEAKNPALGERVQNTGYTYPTGMPNSRDLAQMSSRLWRTGRGNSPIYDKALLDTMVNEGLQRLYAMQRPDGGWGWWQGSSYSDEYMSGYVVYGLVTAKAAGVNVRSEVLTRGADYLAAQMKDEDNIHLLTWMAYALAGAEDYYMSGAARRKSYGWEPIVTGRLYEQRERLTAYSKSLLALTLWNMGEKEKAGVLVRNIENTAQIDETNGTARWRMGNQWWYWWNNDVETNAWALRAFLQIDPNNRLTPMMMKWLTTQARGNHWRSTKETAMAVYALADYVRVNKELEVDYILTVNLNGKLQRTYRVTSENALYFDNRFITGDLFLQNGDNTLTITKQGKGNLYWSAASEYFSLEEPIKASGNEIAIKRRYFKLTRNPAVRPEQGESAARSTPASGATTPASQEFARTEIKDNSVLQSGDLIEVELILDSNNDYSYLVFEDMKAAGLEPVDLRSGAAWGDGLCSNVELRDEKVALFVDHLPQGTRVLRYRMRAEIPGTFHALPTNGYAMYAPEVRAISDEWRMGVRD